MLMLSLFWLLLGCVVGALGLAAGVKLPAWGRFTWLLVLVIGALATLVGGWLGVLILGRYVASAVALWVGVVGVVIPWPMNRR